MFDRTSHRIEIFFILLFILFATLDSNFAIHYWTAAIITGICFITDLMFFNDSDFIYDPDYNHWKELYEPKDFQFKSD